MKTIINILTLFIFILNFGSSCSNGDSGSGDSKKSVDYLQVRKVSPTNNSKNKNVDTELYIEFSQTIFSSSVNINTNDNQCFGGIQLSKDNFQSCIKFRNFSVHSNSITLSTASILTYSTTYLVQINNSITGINSEKLETNYISKFSTTKNPVIGNWQSPCQYLGGGEYYQENLIFTDSEFSRIYKNSFDEECNSIWMSGNDHYSYLFDNVETNIDTQKIVIELMGREFKTTFHSTESLNVINEICSLSFSKGQEFDVAGSLCNDIIRFPEKGAKYFLKFTYKDKQLEEVVDSFNNNKLSFNLLY